MPSSVTLPSSLGATLSFSSLGHHRLRTPLPPFTSLLLPPPPSPSLPPSLPEPASRLLLSCLSSIHFYFRQIRKNPFQQFVGKRGEIYPQPCSGVRGNKNMNLQLLLLHIVPLYRKTCCSAVIKVSRARGRRGNKSIQLYLSVLAKLKSQAAL